MRVEIVTGHSPDTQERLLNNLFDTLEKQGCTVVRAETLVRSDYFATLVYFTEPEIQDAIKVKPRPDVVSTFADRR